MTRTALIPPTRKHKPRLAHTAAACLMSSAALRQNPRVLLWVRDAPAWWCIGAHVSIEVERGRLFIKPGGAFVVGLKPGGQSKNGVIPAIRLGLLPGMRPSSHTWTPVKHRFTAIEIEVDLPEWALPSSENRAEQPPAAPAKPRKKLRLVAGRRAASAR